MGVSKKKATVERRRFPRAEFHVSLECQYYFDARISDLYLVRSRNISQAGLLIEAPFEIPLGATIFFQVDRKILLNKIETKKLQSYVEIEIGDKSFVKLCGKVIRMEGKGKNFFLIAVHLINR